MRWANSAVKLVYNTFMKIFKSRKHILLTIVGILISAYLISLLFLDTNNIINCSGKDTSNYSLNKTYSMQEIAEKGRSLGYGVEHFPDDVSIIKKSGNKYFQKFILYAPKDGETKWKITSTNGSGYCKLKDSSIRGDAKALLNDLDIETNWLEKADFEVFHYSEMFDFIPDISL